MRAENQKLEKQLTNLTNMNRNFKPQVVEEESSMTIESQNREPPKMKRIGGGYLPP